jgi:formylglycine-generating enzyme required for sulfatase activity
MSKREKWGAGSMWVRGSSGKGFGKKVNDDWKAGNWHHIVVSFEGENVTIYSDGKNRGNGKVTPVMNGLKNFTFSTKMKGFGFHGQLDDLRIYDRILTESEIIDIYEMGQFASKLATHDDSDDEKQASLDINLLTPEALNIVDNWFLEDGEMTARQSKQKGNIWTKEKFGDFKLSLEYKTSEKANSGLFFRADPVDPVQRGFEIQIASPGLYNGNTVVGSLYGAMAPMVEAGKPDGEWNSMELICDGPQIKARLNGQEILDLNIDDWKDAGKNPDGTKNKFKSPLKDLSRSGLIGFQYYGQQIWFRNVIIRSLESEDITDLKTSIEEKFKGAMKKPVGEGIHIVESAANMEMIWCKPGTFMMGSPETEVGRSVNEMQHEVTLTKGFFLGKYEVTQAEYEKIMVENPSRLKGNRLPVDQITWNDAIELCEKLTKLESKKDRVPYGWSYTLPTEAEWEFACRAGTTTIYSWGNEINPKFANYLDSKVGKTREVGSYQSNSWGFFDMHGNVWELTYDWMGNFTNQSVIDPLGPSSGKYRVERGGSWYYAGTNVRSAKRPNNNLGHRQRTRGFRLCLKEIKEEAKQASIPDKVNLNEGLVGWWKFDETKGKIAKDSSGKKRNGELKNFDSDTAQWVIGTVGNALRFDGKNDYVDIGDFEWGGACSFSGWVRYEKFQNYSRIFDFDQEGTPVQFYLSNGKDESNELRLISRSSKQFAHNGLVLNDVLQADRWNHLAFTWGSNGNLNVFSQGKKISDPPKPIFPVPKVMRSSQYFGKSQSKPDAYFNGEVDDIRIYDRTINETEINALFAMGNPKGIKAGFVEGEETLREENNNSLISEPNNQAQQSQEPVRIFKSAQGSLFEGRVLSYEENNFFLEGKDAKIISVTLNQLSKEDQKYLNETVQAGKIGTGNPHETKSLPVEGKPWTLPSIGMEMIWCEPGNFMMGDNDKVEGQKNPYSGKKSPSHKVTFTKGFFLGKYEVTQEQFQKVMGKNPSEFKDNKHPVEKVTWKDAVAFCEILTANEKKVGWKFSLPTESQWEYACRAGTNTKYSWGNTISLDMANYGATGLKKTMSVGSYRSNPWGFFDMHGNVYEWCTDWFKSYPQGPRTDPQGPNSGSLKVIRGGAWRRIGDSAMSAHREYRKPEQYRYHDLGFRVCLMQVKEEVKQSSISGKVNLNDD